MIYFIIYCVLSYIVGFYIGRKILLIELTKDPILPEEQMVFILIGFLFIGSPIIVPFIILLYSFNIFGRILLGVYT